MPGHLTWPSPALTPCLLKHQNFKVYALISEKTFQPGPFSSKYRTLLTVHITFQTQTCYSFHGFFFDFCQLLFTWLTKFSLSFVETIWHKNRKDINILPYFTYSVNVKPFPGHKDHRSALIFVFLALSQTPVFTLWDHGYGASASRGVPV